MKIKPNPVDLLCRICAKEDNNFVSIYGEAGRNRAIQMKIRICLNITVEETDRYPKRICISCLNKLEDAWNLMEIYKEGQIIIEKKIKKQYLPISDDKGFNPKNGKDKLSECGVCNLEVHDNHLGICCEDKCQRWFHCHCINMSELEYHKLSDDSSSIWICRSCKSQKEQKESYFRSIEQKVKTLQENEKISLSGTALISLASSYTPPPKETAPSDMMVSHTPTTYIQSPVPVVGQTDTFYSGSVDLISTPDMSHPKPLHPSQPPVPTPRRTLPASKSLPCSKQDTSAPVKRRAIKEGNSSSAQPLKKSNQMCIYCNKSFPDDIIDHHVNLHLRKSFITCIECNKNFRSEEAMSRHRCGVSESINLDSDDEETVYV